MSGHLHLQELRDALDALHAQLDRLDRWGRELAGLLGDGGRLLVVGNGGSAAQAQHLTAEVVGRYRADRRPLSAIALHTDTSTVTALVNDYGADEVFARQVRAHGRRGDALLALSTSGRSPNVLAAVDAADEVGMWTLAMVGRCPNPLAAAVEDLVSVDAETPTVQEVHQVAIHLVCESLDDELAARLMSGVPGELWVGEVLR